MKDGRGRRAAADFFIGFFATVLIVLPVFFTAFEIGEQRRERASDNVRPAAEARTDIPVSAPLSFNLMVEMHSALTGELSSVSLVRFDTASKRMCAVTLPASCVVLWDQEPDTLMSLYASRGALGVRQSVEDTLSIPISGYISLSSDAMSDVVDALGGFYFTLQSPVEVADSDGRTVYTREAGSTRLYGNDVVQLALNGGYYADELVRLHERLWSAALDEVCTRDDLAALLERCVALARERGAASDLGPALLGELKRAAGYICGPDCLVNVTRPDGVFADTVFQLSQGADEKLWRLFPKV